MPGTPTTKYAIPTLNASGTDAINVSHTALNSAFTTIDAAMAGYAEGTFAGKPAAGKTGRIYRCIDTGQWLADTGTVWVDLNAAPALVTSLPGSPFDGQEIYFSADPTNGVVWHLRYRSASGSSYKWEYVGGSELAAEVSTVDSLANVGGTYTDFATVGPSVTVPLAGDYEVSLGADVALASAAQAVDIAPKFGAAAVDTLDRIAHWAGTGVTGGRDSPARTIRRTVTSASTAIKLQYTSNAAAGAASRRFLRVRPVRVG